MTEILVPAQELQRRTIRRSDWVSCNSAFIDCRTPGSDRKSNYAFIGSGVSQTPTSSSTSRSPRLQPGSGRDAERHTNNLHLHFTAEVFINFGGTFRVAGGSTGGRVSTSPATAT